MAGNPFVRSRASWTGLCAEFLPSANACVVMVPYAAAQKITSNHQQPITFRYRDLDPRIQARFLLRFPYSCILI